MLDNLEIAHSSMRNCLNTADIYNMTPNFVIFKGVMLLNVVYSEIVIVHICIIFGR